MLQIVAIGAISYFIINALEKRRDGLLVFFNIITFVALPALVIMLAGFVAVFLSIPLLWLAPLGLLYFLFPLLYCRYQMQYPWKTSALYGGIVWTVHLVVGLALG